MATEFSGRGGDRSYSGLVKSFGRVGGPGYIPFAGASEAAPAKAPNTPRIREKAAKAVEGKVKPRTYKGVSGPVTVTYRKPEVPSGTRAARLRTRPLSWRGLSAEHSEAADRSAKSTSTVMHEEMKDDTPMRRDKGGKLVSRAYTDFDNADDTYEDQRTNKGRLKDAEYGLSKEKKDTESGKMARSILRQDRPRRYLESAGRVGGPWARKGAGIPELGKAFNAEEAVQGEVWKARGQRSKKKKLDLAREASRQKAVGIKSPVVTKPEVEARTKRVARIQRGMPGTPRGGAKSVLGFFAEPIVAAGVGAVRAAVDPKVSVGEAFDWWKKKYTSDPLKKTYGESRTF